MSICKYCRGTGRQEAGWNYLAHDCPDCYGTGEEIEMEECLECGEEYEKRCTWQDTCEECMEKKGEEE